MRSKWGRLPRRHRIDCPRVHDVEREALSYSASAVYFCRPSQGTRPIGLRWRSNEDYKEAGSAEADQPGEAQCAPGQAIKHYAPDIDTRLVAHCWCSAGIDNSTLAAVNAHASSLILGPTNSWQPQHLPGVSQRVAHWRRPWSCAQPLRRAALDRGSRPSTCSLLTYRMSKGRWRQLWRRVVRAASEAQYADAAAQEILVYMFIML